MILHQNHKEFEDSIVSYLESKGFITESATYHDVMSDSMQNILSSRYSLTLLYLRGRADRIAVHKEIINLEFEWESKTHDSPKWKDLTLEMLPLLHHKIKAAIGVKVLYIIKDADNCEKGFWIDKLPIIREIHIPNRWTGKPHEKFFNDFAMSYFPNVNIRKGIKSGGSGDPYIIIDYKTVRTFPDWKTLIEEYRKSVI